MGWSEAWGRAPHEPYDIGGLVISRELPINDVGIHGMAEQLIQNKTWVSNATSIP